MNFPLFIFYELLIRISEIKPEVGEYLSFSPANEFCILRTSNGRLLLPVDVISRQLKDPSLITEAELKELAMGFEVN